MLHLKSYRVPSCCRLAHFSGFPHGHLHSGLTHRSFVFSLAGFTTRLIYALDFGSAGGVKFGLHIENWNWSVSGLEETNNTYATFGLVFGVRGQKSLQVLPSGPQDYELVAEYEKLKIVLSLDWGIVLDSRPAIFAYRTVDQPLTLSGESYGPEWFGFNTSVSFCQPTPQDAGINLTSREPLEHWNSMYYDPSLQVIFGDLGGKIAPNNARTWVLAVSITLPILAALIILSIILIIIFVPSVKTFFMPYNREHLEHQRSTHRSANDTDSNTKEWKRSMPPRSTE